MKYVGIYRSLFAPMIKREYWERWRSNETGL